MTEESNSEAAPVDVRPLDYAPPGLRRPVKQGDGVESAIVSIVTVIILIIGICLAIVLMVRWKLSLP
jgi:hypothetical protein